MACACEHCGHEFEAEIDTNPASLSAVSPAFQQINLEYWWFNYQF
jgi:hypothetical protein